jgi:DNA-binding transcriptional MerR regulator
MERCGASFRQVDYWSRMGYISPVNSQSGPGYKRLYDEHAFEMACRFSSFMLLRQREVREVAELLSQPDPVLEDGWLVMRSEDGAVEVRFRPVLDSHTPNEVTAP